MPDDFLNPDTDPFRPPAANTMVGCLHCGQQYDSYRIEWRTGTSADGEPWGFWCCPIPDCDGQGFGFDILPTDPNYRDERGGWCYSDEDEEDYDDIESLDDTESETPPRKPGDESTPW